MIREPGTADSSAVAHFQRAMMMGEGRPRRAVTCSRGHVILVVAAVAVQHEVRSVSYGCVVGYVRGTRDGKSD